jgi:hypothetical protein
MGDVKRIEVTEKVLAIMCESLDEFMRKICNIAESQFDDVQSQAQFILNSILNLCGNGIYRGCATPEDFPEQLEHFIDCLRAWGKNRMDLFNKKETH